MVWCSGEGPVALGRTGPSKEAPAEGRGAGLGLWPPLLALPCSLKSVCADGRGRKMTPALSFIPREGDYTLRPLLSGKPSQKKEQAPFMYPRHPIFLPSPCLGQGHLPPGAAQCTCALSQAGHANFPNSGTWQGVDPRSSSGRGSHLTGTGAGLSQGSCTNVQELKV